MKELLFILEQKLSSNGLYPLDGLKIEYNDNGTKDSEYPQIMKNIIKYFKNHEINSVTIVGEKQKLIIKDIA